MNRIHTLLYSTLIYSAFSPFARAQVLSIVLTTNATNFAVSPALSFTGHVGATYRLLSSNRLDTPVSTWPTFTNVLGTDGQVLTPASLARSKFQAYALAVRTNQLYGWHFYVDTNSPAMRWMLAQEVDDPTNAALMSVIATNPAAMWLTGVEPDPAYDVTNRIAVAGTAGEIPIFTLYNIPHRDCSGSFSSGGAVARDRTWGGSEG